jgi:hypothetical protein
MENFGNIVSTCAFHCESADAHRVFGNPRSRAASLFITLPIGCNSAENKKPVKEELTHSQPALSYRFKKNLTRSACFNR